ncbi:MAG: hypothetical protein LLF94_01385 [Chlamydiales bacterium]|nr:hypothetical protein [Chlamydiales bacterium]
MKVIILFASLLLMAQSFCDDFESHIHFGPKPTLGMIKLTDRSEAISQSTWIYINTALNHYKATKPAAIILELNSPGGEVFAAERIADALKDMDTQHGIPIICYIDNWAISAGAMLAYSCRYIVTSKDASMGAAEPVIMGEGGTMEAASEKMNSALRTDFANHAKFFDRNPYIAEAMVDKDIILVMRDGKIIKLDSEDDIKKDAPKDIIISPKGKLLTLNTDQLLEYGIANMSLPPEKLEPLTFEEEESGTYPLAKTALKQIPYFQKMGDISVDEFQLNWQTKFLALLASPAVSSLLFMVLMISIYMELSTGGFGVAGAVALISVFLVGLSSFALEAIHVLEPLLLGFGLILVGLELFFFPTLGILGVIGAIFMLMGIAGIMLPGLDAVSYENNTLNAAGEYVFTRLTWLSGAFLLSLAIIAILSRYMWPKLGVSKFLILSDDKQSTAAVAGNLPKFALPPLGSEAKVSAALRPAGKVTVGDTEFDAVSTGSFLDEGTNVRVVRIEGAKVVVEEQY